MENEKESKDISDEKEQKKCKHGILHGFGEFCHNCVIESLESRLKEAQEKVQECDRLHAIPQVQIKLLEQRLSQAEAENEGLKEKYSIVGNAYDQRGEEILDLKKEVYSLVRERNLYNKNYLKLETKFKAEIESRKRLSGDLHKFHPDILALNQSLEHGEKEFIAMTQDRDRLTLRLSHLMDVAGKMAGALEKIAKKEVEFPEYDWSDWNGGDAHCETQMIIALEAKLALAEWDGIKSKECVHEWYEDVTDSYGYPIWRCKKCGESKDREVKPQQKG